MTTSFITSDNIGAGFRVTLGTNQAVVVEKGVTVGSTNLAALWAGGINGRMDIFGSALGEIGGVSLLNAIDAGVHVWAGGTVGASLPDSFGIAINNSTCFVANHGLIFGEDAVTALLAIDARVENFGEIRGDERAIVVQDTGNGSFTLVNTGVITGGFSTGIAYVSTGNVVDEIVNSGTINGKIELGNGADRYFGANAGAMNEGAMASSGLSISSNVSGGGGSDELVGGTFSDFLLGGTDKDTLRGGAGHDYLSGDAGADLLSGGSGDDFFVYGAASDSRGADRDMIYDFSHSAGDLIDLFAIDANEGKAGNQAFDFIGSAGFSGNAGTLRVVHTRGSTILLASTDTDAQVEFSVNFDGHVALSASDFSL